MCFFGKPQIPAAAATPTPTPAPTPAPTPTTVTPTEIESQTQEQRRQKISKMTKFGLSSTIRTSGQGVTTTPDLYTPAAGGLKSLMGQ